MLSIDGSYLEGGGQILRTALALATLLNKDIEITNIRKGRPNAGLRQQHLTALKILSMICDANVEGLYNGSTNIIFKPNKIHALNLKVNIGTAGSISLLLHQIFPVSLKEDISLKIIGGTDVPFSPSITYLKNVFIPVLKRIGANFSLKLSNYGYFPKGKGRVSFISKEANLPLKPINITKLGRLKYFEIFSHSASLPLEVARNQFISAKSMLLEHFPNVDIIDHIFSSERKDTVGSSIDIFAVFDHTVIGANALGRKGFPAIAVGKEAAKKLLSELDAQMPCDSHLADQLIIYAALASKKSHIYCTKLTKHTLTNIFVTEQLLPVKFSVDGELDNKAKIGVEGIAYQ